MPTVRSPSVWPMSTSSLGTRLTLSITSSTSWKKVPMKTMDHFCGVADADPDDRQGHEADDRHVADEVDERLDERLGDPVGADEDADGHGQRRGEEEARPRSAPRTRPMSSQSVPSVASLPSCGRRCPTARAGTCRPTRSSTPDEQPDREHDQERDRGQRHVVAHPDAAEDGKRRRAAPSRRHRPLVVHRSGPPRRRQPAARGPGVDRHVPVRGPAWRCTSCRSGWSRRRPWP